MSYQDSILKGLHVRLLLPVVLVIAGITGLWTAIGVVYESRLIDDLVADRAESLTASIRHDIVRAMRTGHPSELHDILRDLARNPDVVAARILRPDGTVIRSTRAGEEKSVLASHAEQWNARGDRIDAAVAGLAPRPALHSVESLQNDTDCAHCHGSQVTTIGLLDVDVDVGRQKMGPITWWRFNAALAGMQVVALVGLVYPILGLLVIRPIRQLTRAVDRVQGGRLEPIDQPFGTREFAALGDGFNQMVRRLRETAELEEQKRQLQLGRAEQLAAVGELAAGLAHEIRSPLSAVKAAVEVLADDLPGNDPRRDILTQSAAELGRIGDVTRELLEYARPRPPSFAAVDLNALLDDVILLNEAQAARQGAKFSIDRAGAPLTVEADPSMVRQVLVNLTINALHAVAGRPDARVHISTERRGAEVLCRVRDNGPGVPAAQGEVIFRPFVTSKARGTGLGLAISRRLVEIHRGRLWLENPGHQGASFAFTLPVAEAP